MKALRPALVFAVLFPALVSTFSCFGGSAASTVRKFYSRIEKGEIDAAIGMFSKSFVGQIPGEKLKAAMREATRQVAEKGGVKELEILEENVIGEIADVTVKITYGNGSEETEKVNLVKERGTWKLEPKK